MTSRLNPITGTEMETLSHDESLALATAAGVPERIDRFFSNGQEFAFAEYVREAIAKPARGRRPSIADTHTILTVRGDR